MDSDTVYLLPYVEVEELFGFVGWVQYGRNDQPVNDEFVGKEIEEILYRMQECGDIPEYDEALDNGEYGTLTDMVITVLTRTEDLIGIIHPYEYIRYYIDIPMKIFLAIKETTDV